MRGICAGYARDMRGICAGLGAGCVQKYAGLGAGYMRYVECMSERLEQDRCIMVWCIVKDTLYDKTQIIKKSLEHQEYKVIKR